MKRHAPATLRNRDPILEVLREALPRTGTVLEIASGSGEHVAYFAPALPQLRWQPSDYDASALAGIDAHVKDAGAANALPALHLDVCAPWPIPRADAIVCCNMIHIAPPAATEGLLTGAARILAAGAPLILYGPFREGGVHTAPSNEEFDRSLRARNPEWGVRNLDDVIARAAELGLVHTRTVVMPANNRAVLFHRTA